MGLTVRRNDLAADEKDVYLGDDSVPQQEVHVCIGSTMGTGAIAWFMLQPGVRNPTLP